MKKGTLKTADARDDLRQVVMRVGERSLTPGLERANGSPAAGACFISTWKDEG